MVFQHIQNEILIHLVPKVLEPNNFCGKVGHTCPNYFKLQVAKQATKQKVPMPQAQNPMALIGELVKALNLYINARVTHHSNLNNNSKIKVASKKLWM